LDRARGVQSGPDEAKRSGRRAKAAPVEPGQVKRAVDQDGVAAVGGFVYLSLGNIDAGLLELAV
jgi:hypothetical protein